MIRSTLLIFILISSFNVLAKKSMKFSYELKYSILSVQQKKKKLILSCKPQEINYAYNSAWISECNDFAYDLLNNEYYQSILIEKEIEDLPFGYISYETIKESGSFMKRKSIRQSFKIKKPANN